MPIRRILIAWLALLAVLTAGCAGGSGGATKTSAGDSTAAGATTTATTTPAPTTAAPATTATTVAPGAPTPAAADYAVGSRTLTVVDTSRPTMASPKRGIAGATSRTLPLLVLYPATGSPADTPVADATVAPGRFPIVEFSHGVTASGPAYQGFLVAWVRAGYVVVAPTFPLTSGAGAWADLGDYQRQPGDVSFILDQLVALDTKAGDPLAGHLATKALGVAGHSLGAITTLGFYNSCCGDPRPKAAIEISGAELPFTGGSFASAPKTPLLLIHGQVDKTVPYRGSATAYASLPGPRALLTVPKAGHVDVLFGKENNGITAATTIAFLDLELRGDPTRWNALAATLRGTDVASLAEDGGLPAPGTARPGG